MRSVCLATTTAGRRLASTVLIFKGSKSNKDTKEHPPITPITPITPMTPITLVNSARSDYLAALGDHFVPQMQMKGRLASRQAFFCVVKGLYE